MKYRLVLLLFLGCLSSLFAQRQRGGQVPTEERNGFPDPMVPRDSNAAKSKDGKNKSGRAALDDSTKLIYGPQTMAYFLEDDIINGRGTKKSVDTSLHLFHRYLFQERSSFLTANLGNEGTAVRNLFVKKSDQLGSQMGYNATCLMHLPQMRLNITRLNHPTQMWNIT